MIGDHAALLMIVTIEVHHLIAIASLPLERDIPTTEALHLIATIEVHRMIAIVAHLLETGIPTIEGLHKETIGDQTVVLHLTIEDHPMVTMDLVAEIEVLLLKVIEVVVPLRAVMVAALPLGMIEDPLIERNGVVIEDGDD